MLSWFVGFKYYFISPILVRWCRQNWTKLQIYMQLFLCIKCLKLQHNQTNKRTGCLSGIRSLYLTLMFHTQFAAWRNWNLWPFLFLQPPSAITMSESFLHFCTFCIFQSACQCSMSVLFAGAFSHHTLRSEIAMLEKEWLPASPSPTILMSTCGPLLNCAKLIPDTEMSFTLALVLKHTVEPLRGIRGVMGLARVPEKS